MKDEDEWTSTTGSVGRDKKKKHGSCLLTLKEQVFDLEFPVQCLFTFSSVAQLIS